MPKKNCIKDRCAHFNDNPKGMCLFCENYDEYFEGTYEEWVNSTDYSEEILYNDVQNFVKSNKTELTKGI